MIWAKNDTNAHAFSWRHFCKKKLKIIFFLPSRGARELKLLSFESETKTKSGCSKSLFSKKSPLTVCFHFTTIFKYYLKKVFKPMRTWRTKMHNKNIFQTKFFGSYCAHPLYDKFSLKFTWCDADQYLDFFYWNSGKIFPKIVSPIVEMRTANMKVRLLGRCDDKNSTYLLMGKSSSTNVFNVEFHKIDYFVFL